MDSTPGLGRSRGNGNPFQYSCLGNLMGRGAWWATAHRVCKESDMTEATSTHWAFTKFQALNALHTDIQNLP